MKRILILTSLLWLVGSPFAVAQNGSTMPATERQFLDDSGDPCASCKLYAFATGTSTPQDTFSEVTNTTANAHPVVLDSAGRAVIFLSDTVYDFRLDSAADVTIWTRTAVDAVHGVINPTSTTDLTFTVDSDADEPATFDFINGAAATIAQLNESGDLQLDGALQVDTNVTVGTGTAVDRDVTFDGNAQDYYVGLDDGTDDLIIGLGATVGTTPILTLNESQEVTFTNLPAGMTQCLDMDTTQNATDDGTLETLWSYSLPANTLDENGDSLDIFASGTNAADTDSKILDLDFGSTTVETVTTASSAAVAWKLSATVVRTAAGAQKASGWLILQSHSFQAAGETTYTTPAEDETGTITIAMTGDGINASDIVYEMARVCVTDAP